jgi:hypothetical protein
LMPSCAVAAATSACVWCAGWNGWWLDTPSRHIRLYCPFPYPSHALFFVLFRFFCPTSVHLSRHIVGISFSFIDSTHSPPAVTCVTHNPPGIRNYSAPNRFIKKLIGPPFFF